ncbi:MAG: hypothetical protein C4534_09010 [Gaiellales bacterium]|nr:MAG: hypothetical protein C4534_09010 [Gaiellales bacterium]
MTPKQAVLELLDRLPEDCTLEEIQYRLYLLQAVERGRQDVLEGRTLSHEDFVRELKARRLRGAK